MKRHITKHLLTLTIIVAISATVALERILASTPGVISYQGRLTTAAGVPYPDGAYNVEFTIWGDSISTAPGYKHWNSGMISINTIGGVFTIGLGTSPMTAINSNIFSGELVWLGIKVGSDPELHPRIWLTSVPYAFIAHSADTAGIAGTAPNYLPLSGGTVTGVVHHKNDFHWRIGFDDRAALYPTTSRLSIFGSDTRERVRLSGNTSGQLGLWDNQATPVNTALLTAGAASGGLLQLYQGVGLYGAILNGGGANGGVLDLYTGGGRRTVQLDAGGSYGGALHLWKINSAAPPSPGIMLDAGMSPGSVIAVNDSLGASVIWLSSALSANSSVFLPDSAVDSRELFDEPGISSDIHNGVYNLNPTAWQGMVSTTITIPAAGYIVVVGKARGQVLKSNHKGWVQIDEDVDFANPATPPYYAEFGYTLTGGGAYEQLTERYSVYVDRIYYKSAGTYTFWLKGAAEATTPYYVTKCWDPTIRAMYFPTSYGTVHALVSSSGRGQFENAETVTSTGPDSTNLGAAQTVYKVDLRELEIKAARAQAEAERLQRQLLEARLKANAVKQQPAPDNQER